MSGAQSHLHVGGIHGVPEFLPCFLYMTVDLGVRCLELYLGAKEGLFHHIRN